MQTSGFFDANLISEEEGYDRVYMAEQFANYFSRFIGNGVFSDSAMLQVCATADENWNVIVKPGWGYINGYWYHNDSDLKLSIHTADGVYSRFDAVALRYDVSSREINAIILEGEFATNPSKPQPVRNADYYDLIIGYISIPKGKVGITTDLIIDTRLDAELCGQVEALIEQPDVTQYGSQLNNFIAEYIETSNKRYDSFVEVMEGLKESYAELAKQFENSAEADFNEWFDSIKGKLSTDQAGSLQLQIDDLGEKVNDADILTSVKGNGVIINDASCNGIIVKDLGLNLFKIDISTTTVNGVTFTVNDDGTITANGTATKATLLAANSNVLKLKAGKYTFSGCPANGSISTYDLQPVVNGAWMSWFDLGEGKTMSFSEDTEIKLIIQIAEGFVCDNLVFKPMINAGTEKRRFVKNKPLSIKVCSKNLWGEQIESTDKIILEEGEQSYLGYVISKPISVLNSGVVISLTSVTNINENDKLRIGLYKDGEYVGRILKEFVTGSPVKIDKSNEYDAIKISYNSNTVFKMQIEYSDSATSYEAYRESTVKVAGMEELPISVKSFSENVNVLTEDNAYVEVIYAKREKAAPVIDYAKKVDELEALLSDVVIAVLKDNWTYNSSRALWVNKITITGVSENDTPIYGLHCSSNEPTNDELVAYMNVEDVITYDGYVEITSKIKIGTSFSIILKCTNGSGDSVIANFDEVMANIQKMENDINSLNSNLTANKMDGYEVITDYTEANKYTFPSDGYLEIQVNNSEASVLAFLKGANDKTGVILHENNSYETIFVRKGMKYYTTSKSGNASVLFVPLS